MRLSCLFIGGLVIAGRLMGEDFSVEIPVAAKTPDNAPAPIPMTTPQEQSFAQPDMSQFRKPDNAEPVMSQSVVEPEIPQQTEPTEPPTETGLNDLSGRPHLKSVLTCGSELKSGANLQRLRKQGLKATPIHFHKKHAYATFR